MKRTTAIATMLSLSLVLGTFSITFTTAYAANNPASNKQQPANKKQTKVTKPTPVHTLNELKPIQLTAKSSVKLTDVNLNKQDDGTILTYTLTYYNNEQRSIPLIDYWTKVRTKSGTVYSSNLTTKDKEKKNVPALSQMNVTYYTKIAKHLTVNDLNFDIIKWDFSKSNFENRLGSFSIPTWMMTSTIAGKQSTVRMNDIPIKTSIGSVIVFPSGDSNYVNVAVNIENAGFKPLENPTYKYVLKTASGSNYPLVPDNISKEYKLQPSEKKTLNFMTAVPKNIILNKLEMQVLTEDETLKMNLPIATLSLPQSNAGNSSIAPNKEKIIKINDSKVSTKIVTGWSNQSFDQNEITLTFQFENLTNSPVNIPKYEFEINGPNGLSVPIQTKSLDSLVLKPLEKRPVTLTANVKYDIDVSKLKLQMNRPSDPEQKDAQKDTQKDTKFKYPEGIYGLPELQSMKNQTGIEYNVQHSKGNLGVTIESLQRLPWVDGDILSAKMKIKNKEFKTIQLPALEGVYKLDTADITGKTQVVSSNGALIIGPKEEVDIYIVTKLPSYLDFSQIQVALMEKLGESDLSPMIQFTNGGKLSELPVVKYGSIHSLKTQGRKADITASNSKVYPGAANQVIYTDLIMKSQEERQSILSQMVGYYRTDDGRYYKANITQIQGPTNPQGQNILTAWAKVPSSIDPKKLQFVIGEGITENKLTAPKGESDGYVNAVAMNLDIVQPSFKRDFKDLDFFPYKLSINNFTATANKSSNLSLEFTYDLIRQQDYNIGEYEHKLIIEITDTSGRKFEKALEIGKKDLEEAKRKSFSTSISDTFFEQVENGAFQVSLYDSFQDERIKIASYGSRYNIKNLKTGD
ncbi:hypothetical protein M5X00_01130 [Paenibacillus alvei]|uniref:Uncharacterized protein n=1 Tax=Paenibacillus alvei TaxID=44250 RepID=A0ABT4GS86_PAEAL|nr:hypothetical protein [Paenibacillus alvei]EJW18427.1 hypothetical protein PAV_2c01910 [Paenibacillus alvei DSM 29]MCY7485232.1 hypothetical protein [Paenibacillus alvei]MCY9540268.1 hypothetical protein [Paenibacillus alvei]MCY9703121.1 hypothetical protein [Paenibacillus alvei]MCY9735658.1 hypothetical protein [Paenibacillus alvei]